VTLKRIITISNKDEWITYGERERKREERKEYYIEMIILPSMLILRELFYDNVQMCEKKTGEREWENFFCTKHLHMISGHYIAVIVSSITTWIRLSVVD